MKNRLSEFEPFKVVEKAVLSVRESRPLYGFKPFSL